MNKKIILTCAAFGLLMLTGCASALVEREQSIYVDSSPRDSHCSVTHMGEEEILARLITPNTVSVPRGFETLEFHCLHPRFLPATAYVTPGLETATLLNIFMPLGFFVDVANGTSNLYPEQVYINLGREK